MTWNQGYSEKQPPESGVNDDTHQGVRPTVDEDYSLDRLIQRAKVASPTGKVSPATRKRLETLSLELEDVNKKLEEHQEKQAWKEAQRAVDLIKEEVAREERTAGQKRTQAELDAEFDGLIKGIDKLLESGVNDDTEPGVPQDYTQAAARYHKAAEQGNADAQSYLGYLYDKGQGVPQDYAQAATWYRKAAEQGVAQAQFNLGLLYHNGHGVPQEDTQAAAWYRKAAEQGVAEAQFKLGLAYKDGWGVSQDDAQAAFWFRKAAEQGDAEAQFLLGLSYYLGLGVPQDYVEAYFLLDLAIAGKLNTSNTEQAAKFRVKIASHLTPTALARAQEQGRKWLEAHQVKPPESGVNDDTHQGVSQASVTAPETLSEPEKHMNGEPIRLRGVGGWLLIFCIVTAIIAPLAHIVEAGNSNDTVVILIDVAFTMLAFCTGLSVWRVRHDAFRWVRAYLITVTCLGVVAYVISLGQGSDMTYPTSPAIAEHIATRINHSQTIGSVIGAVIWWQYFKKSKRVNATFGRNL